MAVPAEKERSGANVAELTVSELSAEIVGDEAAPSVSAVQGAAY